MADQKLTDLPAIATGDIDNSVLLYCVDVTGGNISSKVTRSALYLDIANTFTKGQTISPVLLTSLVLNPPTTPVGSASVTFIGGLNLTTGTIAFATTAQSTDYGTARINQATLVNSPGSGTIPNAWSLKIDGPPIASTQVTISNNYALWIASGGTYLQGTLTINTGSSPIVIYNPAGTFAYTLTPSAIVANRQLNIPLTTATDTLAVLGLAQTFSGAITSTGGITMSSSDITLAGNKIKTTSYNLYEQTLEGITALGLTSTVTNQYSILGIYPNGTSRQAGIDIIRIDGTHEYLRILSDLVTTGEFGINVAAGSSGTILPLNIYMNGTKLLSFNTANTITSYNDFLQTTGKKLSLNVGGTSYFIETSANQIDTFANSIQSHRVVVGATLTTEVNNVFGRLGALATTAADGFVYIPAGSGTPTGTPTAFTGKVAMYYDTSAHKIWFFDTNTSTWRGVAVT